VINNIKDIKKTLKIKADINCIFPNTEAQFWPLLLS